MSRGLAATLFSSLIAALRFPDEGYIIGCVLMRSQCTGITLDLLASRFPDASLSNGQCTAFDPRNELNDPFPCGVARGHPWVHVYVGKPVSVGATFITQDAKD